MDVEEVRHTTASLEKENLKLYHSQVDGFIGSSDHFVVAHTEDQARDIVHNMYGGKNGGYRKDQMYVCEVEVDGYEIQVTPKSDK